MQEKKPGPPSAKGGSSASKQRSSAQTRKQPSAAKPPAGRPAKKRKTGASPKKPARRLTPGERRGAQKLLAVLVVAVLLYLLLMMIIAFLVWYSFETPAESEALYSLQIVTAVDKKRIASYSVEQANNSYGLYLHYADLAPLCGFGVAGDEEQVTLFLPGDGLTTDSIVCNRNSSLIQVNGNSVRLSSPILFSGDDYLLPVSLFETYLSGLEITYDDEKQTCTVTVPETLVFSLKLHKPEAASQCESDEFASVPDLSDPDASSSSDPEPSE